MVFWSTTVPSAVECAVFQYSDFPLATFSRSLCSAMTDEEFLANPPAKFVFSDKLDCTPERAFAVLADVDTWKHWFKDCKGCEWDTKPPHDVGSERTIHLFLMDVKERIIAFEPGKRFSFTVLHNSAPVTRRMVENMVLTAEDGHTRVDWTVAYEPTLLTKVAHPIARLIFSRLFRQSLAGLKRYTRPAGV